MQVYDNLIEALNDLKKRGFTTDFKLAFNTLKCSKTGLSLSPLEFEIVEHYRFEEDTNPSDSSVLYAIKAIQGEIKGVLIDAYGVYGEAISDTMIQKLKVNE